MYIRLLKYDFFIIPYTRFYTDTPTNNDLTNIIVLSPFNGFTGYCRLTTLVHTIFRCHLKSNQIISKQFIINSPIKHSREHLRDLYIGSSRNYHFTTFLAVTVSFSTRIPSPSGLSHTRTKVIFYFPSIFIQKNSFFLHACVSIRSDTN